MKCEHIVSKHELRWDSALNRQWKCALNWFYIFDSFSHQFYSWAQHFHRCRNRWTSDGHLIAIENILTQFLAIVQSSNPVTIHRILLSGQWLETVSNQIKPFGWTKNGSNRNWSIKFRTHPLNSSGFSFSSINVCLHFRTKD